MIAKAATLYAIAFSVFAGLAQAKTVTVTLRPGSEGKDAVLFSRKDQVGNNFGNEPGFFAKTWRWNGDSLGVADSLGIGSYRSLIQFDLPALPPGAGLKSATLLLYADTANHTHGHYQDSTPNASYLRRVKKAWAESTVTWSNQPTTETVNEVVLIVSNKAKQDYSVNVRAMVRDMYRRPGTNFGFMLQSFYEKPHNAMTFASGDHPDTALRPALRIEYVVEEPDTLDVGMTVVTFQPGKEGKDAYLFSRTDMKDSNFADSPRFSSEAWTWDNERLGTGISRSLIEFDLGGKEFPGYLKAAFLHLKSDTLNYTKGHSWHTRSNAGWLERVKSAWAETTVTWTNQPATDTAGRVALPKSDFEEQNYKVNVTAMVADMITNPDRNFGLLLRAQTEATYQALNFASGDHVDSTLRPVLELRFTKDPPTRIGGGGKDRLARLSAPAFRVVGRELLLDGPATGLVADLRGNIVARFENARAVSVLGLPSGAYLLQAGGSTYRFVAP